MVVVVMMMESNQSMDAGIFHVHFELLFSDLDQADEGVNQDIGLLSSVGSTVPYRPTSLFYDDNFVLFFEKT